MEAFGFWSRIIMQLAKLYEWHLALNFSQSAQRCDWSIASTPACRRSSADRILASRCARQAAFSASVILSQGMNFFDIEPPYQTDQGRLILPSLVREYELRNLCYPIRFLLYCPPRISSAGAAESCSNIDSCWAGPVSVGPSGS